MTRKPKALDRSGTPTELYNRYCEHRVGPLATVRWCTICRHADVVKLERKPGRGWGMREGNKSRGRMIQHMKDEHSDLLTTGA